MTEWTAIFRVHKQVRSSSVRIRRYRGPEWGLGDYAHFPGGRRFKPELTEAEFPLVLPRFCARLACRVRSPSATSSRSASIIEIVVAIAITQRRIQ